jgi:hypothetical protein
MKHTRSGKRRIIMGALWGTALLWSVASGGYQVVHAAQPVKIVTAHYYRMPKSPRMY